MQNNASVHPGEQRPAQCTLTRDLTDHHHRSPALDISLSPTAGARSCQLLTSWRTDTNTTNTFSPTPGASLCQQSSFPTPPKKKPQTCIFFWISCHVRKYPFWNALFPCLSWSNNPYKGAKEEWIGPGGLQLDVNYDEVWYIQ